MMEKRKAFESFPAYFAYLVSGLAFFSLPTGAQSFAGTLAADIIVFTVVFFALKFLIFLKARAEDVTLCGIQKLFGFVAICFCTVLYSFFTNSFADELPMISKEFAGGRFSHFFVILSLALALYIGKRGFFSYSGVCILVLPLIILPNLLTFFNFLEFGSGAELENAKISGLSFNIGYFSDAFLLCAGGAALFLMKDKTCDKTSRFGLFSAFLAFSVIVLLEGMKYLLWFGAENLGVIERPDRVMLSQVPFMNVQELFLFSFYVAYMLKIAVLATASRIMLARVGTNLPKWAGYAVTASAFYLFYLFLPSSNSKPMAIFAFLGLYICCVAIYVSRIFAKKRVFCKNSPQETKKPK